MVIPVDNRTVGVVHILSLRHLLLPEGRLREIVYRLATCVLRSSPRNRERRRGREKVNRESEREIEFKCLIVQSLWPTEHDGVDDEEDAAVLHVVDDAGGDTDGWQCPSGWAGVCKPGDGHLPDNLRHLQN